MFMVWIFNKNNTHKWLAILGLHLWLKQSLTWDQRMLCGLACWYQKARESLQIIQDCLITHFIKILNYKIHKKSNRSLRFSKILRYKTEKSILLNHWENFPNIFSFFLPCPTPLWKEEMDRMKIISLTERRESNLCCSGQFWGDPPAPGNSRQWERKPAQHCLKASPVGFILPCAYKVLPWVQCFRFWKLFHYNQQQGRARINLFSSGLHAFGLNSKKNKLGIWH